MGYLGPTDKQAVLFGGNDGTSNLNDTWVWDGSNWIQQFPATSPSPRMWMSMTYDESRRQLVLFGGFGWYNDT